MQALKIKSVFTGQFSEEPVVILSPGRINLIGEHTDYNDGFVLPAAIDRSIVVAIAASDSNLSSAIALDLDQSHEFSLNELQPFENGDWRNYVLGVVSEIRKTGKVIGNFNLLFGGDIPIGAGLSSSAALENGIAFALNEVFEIGLSRRELVQISHRAENNFAGVRCGIMDQFATMFCEEDRAIFLDCRTLEYESVVIDFAGFEILLIDTRVKHRLAESEYNARRKTCEEIAAALNFDALRDVTEEHLAALQAQISDHDYQKALFVIQENKRVVEAVDAIRRNDLDRFGNLLFESHQGLKDQYEVSCDELDFLVNTAHKNDAVIGARMIGGGFGGCTINLVKTELAGDFANRVQTEYEQRFGEACEFYNVKVSTGTHKI